MGVVIDCIPVTVFDVKTPNESSTRLVFDRVVVLLSGIRFRKGLRGGRHSVLGYI